MKNSRGFSLPEMLVYIGISSIVMVVGASILILSNRLKSDVSTYVGISEAMGEVRTYLKDETAFKNTVMNNASFSCVANILQNSNATGSAVDCAGKGGSFTLYDKSGNVVKVAARTGNTTDGLNMQGAYCSSFDGASGNNRCPFQITLQWTPICSGSPCTNPVIKISAQMAVKFAAGGQPPDFHLAQNAFQFSMIRQSYAATNQQTCASTGGTWNGTSCSQNYQNSCPGSFYLVGFTSSGQLICRKLKSDRCPSGETFGGFDSNGFMICNSGCDKPKGSGIDPWQADCVMPNCY